MRRLPAVLLVAACAGLAITGAAVATLAQETMSFRRVPPESVTAVEQSTRAQARALSQQAREQVRRELARARAEARGEPVPPEPPAPGAPAELSDSSALPPGETPARSTTGEIVRFGSDIVVPEDQVVDGDVVSIGGNVTVRGKVRGSVTSLGGDVELDSRSRVDGDVVCIGGTLHEEPGSSVGGQRVTAPRTRHARMLLPMLSVVGTGVQMIVHIIALLFMLGIAWLVVTLAPGRTQRALDTLRDEPGPSFLIGLLIWALIIPSVIALALVVAILCITIIGIPLAAAVAVGYVAFFVLAFIWGSVVSYGAIGHLFHHRLKGGTATLLTATLWGVIGVQSLLIIGDMFHVVPFLGVLGGLVKFLFWVGRCVLLTFGAGALVRAEYRRRTVQNWWGHLRSGGAARRAETGPPPPAPPAPPSPPPAPIAG